MALARTEYVRSGDVDIAYQVIGDGTQDVAFVLDWGSHLEALAEQPFIAEFLAGLGRFARVLWFDMRGIGMSGPVTGGSSVEGWMDDLRAVMDAAGSARAALFAHGHGVQMAVMAAAAHPERVASLVLFNGYARFARADDYPAGLPERMHGPYLDAIELNGEPASTRRVLALRSCAGRGSRSGGGASSATARRRPWHARSSRRSSPSTCATFCRS